MFLPTMFGGQAVINNYLKVKIMYNNIKFSIVLLFSILFVSCNEESQVDIGPRGLGVFPAVENMYPSFFDLKNLENAYVEFDVVLPEGQTAETASIEVSFNGGGERKALATLNSFPAKFRISSKDACDLLGVDLANVKLGDVFNLEVLITANGTTTRSNAAVNASVACASNIEGTYNLSATGTGGYGLDSPTPWTSSIATATITSVDGGVTYTITPAMGGIMKDFYSAYGADIVTGEFKDICGEIKNPVINDGWSTITNYTGSINEETGVISISFANPWGDNGVMTLTPQ
jgi:hypothetical protein